MDQSLLAFSGLFHLIATYTWSLLDGIAPCYDHHVTVFLMSEINGLVTRERDMIGETDASIDACCRERFVNM